MTLRFPYQTDPIQGPTPLSLPAGTRIRSRPYIPIPIRSLQSGSGQAIQRALVDSGADDTVFPMAIGAALGVTFLVGPSSSTVIRWRVTAYTMRYGEVEFQLKQGATTCR